MRSTVRRRSFAARGFATGSYRLGSAGIPGEQRDLPERHLLRAMAEVRPCGLVDAVGPVPEVDGVQVRGEDLLLRPALLEAPGQGRLAHLAPDRAAGVGAGVLDELLRDRRAALHDPLLPDVRPERTADRPHVHAVMLEVAPVLDGDDRLLHQRRDVVVVHEDTVLRSAQDGEDLVSRRVVDPRVDLVALARRVALRCLARHGRDEAEGERRERQHEESDREDQ